MNSQKILRRVFSSSAIPRAGHSKWQNIKHTKARNDAKRSSLNTKIAHQIYVAAREGGGIDLERNVRLATAVENALKQNITRKVIDGAISRADKSAGGHGDNAQSITYEGIGPAGVAFIVEAVTENKNRTAQQVRAAFMKFKGSLSPTAFMFERHGFIQITPPEDMEFDGIFERCIEFDGVEDLRETPPTITIVTEPSNLTKCADQVKQVYKISDMGLRFSALEEQAVRHDDLDNETRTRLDKLLTELDDLDDVSNVYTNLVY